MQSTLMQAPPGFEPFVADRIETIRELWDKWKLFPMLFDDAAYPPDATDEEQFKSFANWVMQPSTLLYHYGTQAILGAYNIRPGISANVVILFWDRKLYGPQRIDIVRNGAKFLVSLMHLHRLSAHIWSRNTASIQFSLKVGFHHEGTLRESWPKNGVWYDSVIHGALARDILLWRTADDTATNEALFKEVTHNGHGRRRESDHRTARVV